MGIRAESSIIWDKATAYIHRICWMQRDKETRSLRNQVDAGGRRVSMEARLAWDGERVSGWGSVKVYQQAFVTEDVPNRRKDAFTWIELRPHQRRTAESLRLEPGRSRVSCAHGKQAAAGKGRGKEEVEPA